MTSQFLQFQRPRVVKDGNLHGFRESCKECVTPDSLWLSDSHLETTETPVAIQGLQVLLRVLHLPLSFLEATSWGLYPQEELCTYCSSHIHLHHHHNQSPSLHPHISGSGLHRHPPNLVVLLLLQHHHPHPLQILLPVDVLHNAVPWILGPSQILGTHWYEESP